MLTITIRAVGTFCEMLIAASGPLNNEQQLQQPGSRGRIMMGTNFVGMPRIVCA